MKNIDVDTRIAAPNSAQLRRITPLLTVLLAMLALSVRGMLAQPESRDVLAYRVRELWDSPHPAYYLYDPREQVMTRLEIESNFDPFRWSVDGKLAFSVGEPQGEIFVLDTQIAGSSPVNISQSPTVDDEIEGWSPDGRWLAFTSGGVNFRLHIWDGEKVIDAMPDDLAHLPADPELAWSADGRLAFVSHPPWEQSAEAYLELYVWDGSTTTKVSQYPHPLLGRLSPMWSADGRLAFSSGQDDDDVFVWDGMTLTNVSQNPKRLDISPAWSVDGRLAFLSQQDETYTISVWDGVSFKDGLPDRDTFTSISNDFMGWLSYPEWMPDGRITFSGIDPERHLQIYAWNGETVANISQNPGVHNGGESWSADGRWAFVTFFSPHQEVLVRDAENTLLLRTSGQYNPAWSSDGYLAFCVGDRNSNGWVLSLWDGEQIISLARGHVIDAQWQNGAHVHCTFG